MTKRYIITSLLIVFGIMAIFIWEKKNYYFTDYYFGNRDVEYCKSSGGESFMGSPYPIPNGQYSFGAVDEYSLKYVYLDVRERERNGDGRFYFQKVLLANPPTWEEISHIKRNYPNAQILKIKLFPAFRPTGGRYSMDFTFHLHDDSQNLKGGSMFMRYSRESPLHEQDYVDAWPEIYKRNTNLLNRHYNAVFAVEVVEPESFALQYGQRIVVYFAKTGCDNRIIEIIPRNLQHGKEYYIIISGEILTSNYLSYNETIVKKYKATNFNEPGFVLLGIPIPDQELEYKYGQ